MSTSATTPGKRGLSAALLAGLVAAPAVLAQQRPFPLPSEDWPMPFNDDPIRTFVLADRLEYGWQKGDDTVSWDVQGWVGTDWNRLWLRSEGGGPAGKALEEANLEALYARRITPYWYLQGGVRYDFRPKPERAYAAFGIQGLAPYWFDVQATGYLSERGDLSANLEAEYDLLLTQRLILQPRIETTVSANTVESLGIGEGVSDLQLGLRLRYEIRRWFAPYVGVTWRRAFGETADFARVAGEDVEETAVVAGLRAWY